MVVHEGNWSYIGVSVAKAGENASVTFTVNGKASAAFSVPLPGHGSAFGGAALKLQRFIGSFRAVASFPGVALSAEQHNAFANVFAHSLVMPYFSPAAAVSPTPAICLDPADARTLLQWTNGSPGAAEADEVAALDSGDTLLLCGQASAGVDIDYLSGAPGETLRATVRFRLTGGIGSNTEQVTIATLGDSRHYLTLVATFRGGEHSLSAVVATGATTQLGSALTSGWHAMDMNVTVASGAVSIALDGLASAQHPPMGAPQSIWMYLGQGYRSDNVYVEAITAGSASGNATLCAEVDLVAMRTSVGGQLRR
jgi:hypothetical protein